MFILAPTLVAETNETLSGQASVDTFLPAQFVEETLRVAVYVEDDTALPAYAEGGEYTAYYANVMEFLEGEGFSVTPLSTQDILDRELLAARFDAFVLPNQLPRDGIVNHVKDYWLAGGGILSIGNSLGYMIYTGMIHPSLEGDFGWVGVGPSPWYLVNTTYGDVRILERHPVTKAFAVDDVIPYSENTTVWNYAGFEGLIGDSFHHLAKDDGVFENGAIFALDNPLQGGKIVQIPGDCSAIPAWQHSIITEAIDWLAPRPKGRILFDLSHVPEVTPDPWDPWIEFYTLATWRNGLVNHSYIVDKLYPSSEGNLTADNLEGYDMLVVLMPNLNFSAQEVNDVRDWVADGGGLLLVGDEPPGFTHMMQNLNYLLSWSDIKYNTTVYGPFDTVCSITDFHPITEGITNIVVSGFSYPYVTGDAYAIMEHTGIGIAVAGEEYGNGRVIACPDGNFFTEELGIFELGNYQFHMNIANWLTSATAKVLLYNDEFIDPNMAAVAPALALESLGIKFFLTNNDYYFNLSLYEYWDKWDLVIIDQPGFVMSAYLDNIQEWVESGGKLISSLYWITSYDYHPLWPLLGFIPEDYAPDQPDIHIWAEANPVFNIPAGYDANLFRPTMDYGSEGSALRVFANATSLAGLTASPEDNQSIIVLRNDEQTLFNAFLIDEFQGDYDNSTYMDSFELWVNEIGFMYFDRPTIDSPADVTYMETDIGNEITWSPTADAGPWEYVFSVNGTPEQGGRWTGGLLTFNIDGVNASITEYELTVFDRLGYGVSDLVILNVTEYIAPGPGPLDIDPMLLLIIGGAIGAVVILAVVCSKRGKTE
jgi:hypothetical protein